LKQIEWGSVVWIHLAQRKDQWWSLMITMMHLRFHSMVENFLT